MEEKILREEVKNFYNLIKDNDIEGMQKKVDEGFPIKWMSVFSQKSLPEYAMENGNVQAAWWLMANGHMPESWSSFGGSAWKSFLKKGLSMALSNDNTGISLSSYKNIVKIAVKTTGENLPSFIDSAISQSANVASVFATSIFNSLMHRMDMINESKEQEKTAGDEEENKKEAPVKNDSDKPKTTPKNKKKSPSV